jgi:two-component system OmpR family sensor kinase
MNLRLSTRLLLSYVVVLAVTLGVIVAALLVFLNTRAVPPQRAYQQLGISAQTHLRQFLRPMFRPLTPEAFLTQLAEFSDQNGVRTLVLDLSTSGVIFDSAGVFAEEELLTLRPDIDNLGALPPGLLLTAESSLLEVTLGRFNNPTGSTWLFVGVIAPRQSGGQVMLMYAAPQPTQTLRAALEEFGSALARPIIQAAFVGLVIAAFLAVIGSRAIARPLMRIADASRAVAAGDYNQKVPVNGPLEVRTLAEAFNQMTQEVQASQKAQQDFMVNVSHDLKTPLTSIQGYAQAIMDGATPDPVQSAAIIYEEATRLTRMVAEITDLARLQDGQLSLNRVDLDVSQIVQAIGQRLAIVAEKEGVDLQVDAEPMPLVYGDGDRLAQVITNLISNAIKYTPGGGRVRVKTQVNNGGVEIIVSDTGVGLSKEDLPRIFERFYQVDKARSPRRGTGLGLAITREIVQAHGGTISVTSAGENHGSIFTVWLPSEHVNTVVTGKRS